MMFKKIYILLLVLTIILLAVPSGNASGWVQAPIDLDLSLSRPPKIGETAELDFSVSISPIWVENEPQSFENARAWVEFSYANHKGSYLEARNTVMIPMDEVLVSGELYWEGNAVENNEIELHGTVRLPREGIWIIRGCFPVEGFGKPLEDRITVAVTENVSEFLGYSNFKYMLAGIFNHLTGRSLSYLSYYPYGHGPQRTLDEDNPTVLTLDIPKIPKAGEEVIISCCIESLLDGPGYSAKIEFARRLGDGSIDKIPGGSLLVDGDLEWRGNLKKGEPVKFSATVIFPENGDWRIQVLGDNLEFPGNLLLDTIEMHINDNKGYYGWGEQIIKWDFGCTPKPAQNIPTIPPYSPPSIPE
jgi:hypothetical protein